MPHNDYLSTLLHSIFSINRVQSHDFRSARRSNMKFNTGFFDSLFGKKTLLEVPQDDGTTQKITVTVAWLKKMESEGKLSMSEKSSTSVPFYVIGPDGYETQNMKIGEDIPEEQYKKLRDPENGALYGLTIYEKGEPKTTVIPKEVWEQAKAQFGEIDSAAEEFRNKNID